MTEQFIYNDGSVRCTGHLALPSGADARPGVVVFADLMGVGAHSIERAEILARDLGYVALAADMYGRPVSSQEEAFPLMQAFNEDPQMMARRAGAALTALKGHARCNGKIGAIGFCFGGAVVITLAREQNPDMLGGVSFHGVLATSKPAKAPFNASLLVCHGAEDPFAPINTVVDFLQEMAAIGADCQTIAYTGVGHSFTAVGIDELGIDGVKYHAPTDRRSWKSMTHFFSEVFS